MMEPLPPVRVPHPHVITNAEGSPYVRDTPVPVRRLWRWHRRGVTVDTLLKRYPSLRPAQVLDALSFAYDNRDVIEADLARDRSDHG